MMEDEIKSQERVRRVLHTAKGLEESLIEELGKKRRLVGSKKKKKNVCHIRGRVFRNGTLPIWTLDVFLDKAGEADKASNALFTLAHTLSDSAESELLLLFH